MKSWNNDPEVYIRQQREYWRQVDESKIEGPEAFIRKQNEYWRQVDESEGFDLEGILAPQGTIGLSPFNCANGFSYSHLVDLYAKLGLHRYNMLEGTNFQLIGLIKFNTLMNCLSSYYITLVACDPVTCLVQNFQVKVDEKTFGRLDLTVSVARPKGSSTTLRDDGAPHDLYNDGLAEWPSEDAFNDRKRFYMVEESELRDTDWIRLYLELVLCSKDKKIEVSDLSKIKIVKVAIETSNEDVEPPNERLKAKSAIFYITFRLASRGISEHVERRAIVRRVLNERTGNLILLDVLTPFKKETGLIERLLRSPVTPEVLSMVRSMSRP